MRMVHHYRTRQGWGCKTAHARTYYNIYAREGSECLQERLSGFLFDGAYGFSQRLQIQGGRERHWKCLRSVTEGTSIASTPGWQKVEKQNTLAGCPSSKCSDIEFVCVGVPMMFFFINDIA